MGTLVKGSLYLVEKPGFLWLSIRGLNTLNFVEMCQQLQVFFETVPETARPTGNPKAEALQVTPETGPASSVLNSTHGKSVPLSAWS